MDFNRPSDLLNAYRNGFDGAICDPEETAELLGKLKTPLFGAAAHTLYGAGEGKLSLPFLSLLKFDPAFGPSERQTTGDCVSHATRNAIDVTRAVEIDIKCESDIFARHRRSVVPSCAPLESIRIREMIRGYAAVLGGRNRFDEIGNQTELVIIFDKSAEDQIANEVVDCRGIEDLAEPLGLLLNADRQPSSTDRLVCR